MARFKSTTTPAKFSSSKTKANNHTGDRRSSRSNAVVISTPVQSSPSKRKADSCTDGSRSSKRRATAADDHASDAPKRTTSAGYGSPKGEGKEIALTDTQLFSIRHPSVFGDAYIKPEEPDVDILSVPATPCHDSNDQIKLLDYVLMGSFGSEARRHAVDQLLQTARQSASSETDFGVTYVEATVSRLKQKGIKEPRLAEVIAMLQEGLWQPLVRFRARVDGLGASLPSPASLPPEHGQVGRELITNTHIDGLDGVDGAFESHSSQQLPSIVQHNGEERSVSSRSDHTGSESSDSSSDDDENCKSSVQKNSRYRDDDDEEHVESSSRAARPREHVEHEDGKASVKLTTPRSEYADNVVSQLTFPAQ